MRPPGKKLFSKGGMAWGLKQLELDDEGRAARDSDLRLLEAAAQERERLHRTIDEGTCGNDHVWLMMTLPGVSVAVATALIAA
jgi:hypothetical protein